MSFHAYFERNNDSLKIEKIKLASFQSTLQIYKDKLEKSGNKPSEIVTLTKRKEKSEKQIAKLEETITNLEFLAGNPDELVKKYLQSLPIKRKDICLEDIFEKHSLTNIPDLSRFNDIEVLRLSNNRRLSSGFDRLPTTLKKLYCYKTDIPNEDTAWILRLVNLETLELSRNDRVRELPEDLTALTKLKKLYINQMELRSIPTLPLTIKTLLTPITKMSRYFTKSFYSNKKRLSFDIGYRIEDITPKSEATRIILHINRVNRFDKIREELLEKGGRIIMNPARIERLLDQSEIELDSDWSDIFEFQERREYSYV